MNCTLSIVHLFCFIVFQVVYAGFLLVLLVAVGVYPFASTSNGESLEIRRSQRLTVNKNDPTGAESENKSIFKDIIVNYNRKIENSNENKCTNSENKCYTIVPANSEFAKDLFNFCKYYISKNVKAKLDRELQFEIYKCNSIIMGEPIVETEKIKNVRNESPKRVSLKMQLFPRSAWVYSTPENQKIKCVQLESAKSQLQPVILRTTNRNKMLYELDDKNVVFGRSCGDVVFDEVMAQPIANFSRNVDEDWAREEEVTNENVSRFLVFFLLVIFLIIIIIIYLSVWLEAVHQKTHPVLPLQHAEAGTASGRPFTEPQQQRLQRVV